VERLRVILIPLLLIAVKRQEPTPTGPKGSGNYSTWIFTLTSKYTSSKQGDRPNYGKIVIWSKDKLG